MKIAVGTALLATVATASLIQPPSAVADPAQSFCQAMANVGYRADCTTLTKLAKDVCAGYDRGLDSTAAAQMLDATTKNEGLSNYIVAGAPLYFCPQYQGKA